MFNKIPPKRYIDVSEKGVQETTKKTKITVDELNREKTNSVAIYTLRKLQKTTEQDKQKIVGYAETVFNNFTARWSFKIARWLHTHLSNRLFCRTMETYKELENLKNSIVTDAEAFVPSTSVEPPETSSPIKTIDTTSEPKVPKQTPDHEQDSENSKTAKADTNNDQTKLKGSTATGSDTTTNDLQKSDDKTTDLNTSNTSNNDQTPPSVPLTTGGKETNETQPPKNPDNQQNPPTGLPVLNETKIPQKKIDQSTPPQNLDEEKIQKKIEKKIKISDEAFNGIDPSTKLSDLNANFLAYSSNPTHQNQETMALFKDYNCKDFYNEKNKKNIENNIMREYLPHYDERRVRLQNNGQPNETDFVLASADHVWGNRLILAEGPKNSDEIEKFWQMAWEKETSYILRMVDAKKTLSSPRKDQLETNYENYEIGDYGAYSVKAKKISTIDNDGKYKEYTREEVDFFNEANGNNQSDSAQEAFRTENLQANNLRIVLSLEITHKETNKTKEITIDHFGGWKDEKNIPPWHAQAVLAKQIVEAYSRLSKNEANDSVVVHCNFGVSKTAVTWACLRLLKETLDAEKKGEDPPKSNIPKLVMEGRRDIRRGMIRRQSEMETIAQLHKDCYYILMNKPLNPPSPLTPPQNYSSISTLSQNHAKIDFPDDLKKETILSTLKIPDINNTYPQYKDHKDDFFEKNCKESLNLNNKSRTRYGNIHQWDANRVRLHVDPKTWESDYINAGTDPWWGKDQLILSQGPKEETTAHHWQMIWEQDISRVFCLTRHQEPNEYEILKEKLALYAVGIFDDYTTQAEKIVVVEEEKGELVKKRLSPYEVYLFNIANGPDNFSVKKPDGFKDWLQSKGKSLDDIKKDYKIDAFDTKYKSYVITTNVKKESTGETKKIVLDHFSSWPDHGVPEGLANSLFADKVEKAYSLLRQEEKILVHCSAGIGRTGVFRTVLTLLQKAEQALAESKPLPSKDDFNIPFEVLVGRATVRPGLVQTDDQLDYIPYIYEDVKETARFVHDGALWKDKPWKDHRKKLRDRRK